MPKKRALDWIVTAEVDGVQKYYRSKPLWGYCETWTDDLKKACRMTGVAADAFVFSLHDKCDVQKMKAVRLLRTRSQPNAGR